MDLPLDISTLLIIGMLSSAVLGIALGWIWLTDRREGHVAIWALAFGLGAIACGLFLLRGPISDWEVLMFGDAAMALGYGLAWAGFRSFEGGRPSRLLIAGGALLWAAFCFIPVFYDNPDARGLLVSVVTSVYCLAIARSLYNGRFREPLPARLPVATLFAAHGVVFALRVPLTLLMPQIPTEGYSWLFALASLETLAFMIAAVVAVLVLTLQRSAHVHCCLRERDPLTGLPNRQAFCRQVDALIEADPSAGVLILFDLDHFRVINDTFGHAEADRAIVAFADIVRSQVKAPDVFGRLGGEEFALYMPGVALGAGMKVADYLCHKTEQIRVMAGPLRIPLTTSAGVASLADAGPGLDKLRSAADWALVEAKRDGRNRARAYRRPPTLTDVAA